MLQKRGKLIVIEGGDGSGKGTQSKLLLEYLKKNSIPHAYVDFPDYDSFYGKMVGQFLRGEYGTLENVSPYLTSLLFALDRRDTRDTIQGYLDRGKIVIANRYVTSNIAHQGSKIQDSTKKAEFIAWLEQLEYDMNQMPKEDIVLYLKVPSSTTGKLIEQKEARAYLNGQKADIQEKDETYRKQTEDMYDLMARTNQRWVTIECMKHGTMVSREEISKQIVEILQKNNIL